MMKIIKSLFFLMSLTLLSCSKDPEFPKPDYRDKFVGTYEMTFEMHSSNSYYNTPRMDFDSIVVMETTVRKTTPEEAKLFSGEKLWDTQGFVIDGIGYLSSKDGAFHRVQWFRTVPSTGDASRFGYEILIFRNDSLFIGDQSRWGYARNESYRTDGKGKKIR